MNDVKYKSGIGFLLAALGRKAESLWNAFLQEHGMTTAEFTALSVLDARGPCMQKQLAKDIEVDPRNVVAIVDKLRTRGWAASVASEHDGRAKIISITTDGQRVLRDLYGNLQPIETAFLHNLTKSEAVRLRQLLVKLKD